MKYRFAGNIDVPEWILAEVSTLSKISCVRLKLITRQLIAELAGGSLDAEKITKLVGDKAGFTWSDIRAALAAITFILRGAVRYDVDEGEELSAPAPASSLPPAPSPPHLTHTSGAQCGAAAAGSAKGKLGRLVPPLPHPPRALARAGRGGLTARPAPGFP